MALRLNIARKFSFQNMAARLMLMVRKIAFKAVSFIYISHYLGNMIYKNEMGTHL